VATLLLLWMRSQCVEAIQLGAVGLRIRCERLAVDCNQSRYIAICCLDDGLGRVVMLVLLMQNVTNRTVILISVQSMLDSTTHQRRNINRRARLALCRGHRCKGNRQQINRLRISKQQRRYRQ